MYHDKKKKGGEESDSQNIDVKVSKSHAFMVFFFFSLFSFLLRLNI
jgi:hypothetical protein